MVKNGEEPQCQVSVPAIVGARIFVQSTTLTLLEKRSARAGNHPIDPQNRDGDAIIGTQK